jgi:MFS family permease
VADRSPTRRARLRGLVLDVSPLREFPVYRRLWMGQAVNIVGSQITRIALPYQVYVLTGSTLAIAALTFVQLVPILAFTLLGGSLADAVDRRRLLLVAQMGLAGSSLALLVLSLTGSPPVWALLVVAFVAASFSSLEWPTRGSTIPRLVSPERFPAAIALGQLSFNAGSVVGPAIGGLILATFGVSGAYAVDVLTFAASIVAILGLPRLPPLAGQARFGVAAIRESLRFVRDRRVILSTFAIDLDAMIFGMPASLFPVLALDVFRTGPVGVGLLAAAPAAGAFLGVALSGGVTRLRRVGLGIIVAVVAWGIAITLFGLASFSFALALAFLAVAGAADVLSAVMRSSLVQLATPDGLRGRVTAIHTLVVSSGPRIGDVEAAAVASLIGAQLSVVSGGLLCLLGVVAVARAFPELARYELPRTADEAATPG